MTYGRRSLRRGALPLAVLAVLLVACGTSSGDADASAGPLVSLVELAPSYRTAPAFSTSNAVRVEIGAREVRIDGRRVAELTEGRFAANAVQQGRVPAVTQALAGGRTRAAIWVHVAVPYQTTYQVLATLAGAGVTEIGFAVRKLGATPGEGWITFSGFRVVPMDLEEVPFDLVSQVGWDDFTNAWDDVASACESAGESDCTHKPRFFASGGRLQITTLARGDGLSIRMTRVGAPPPEQVHIEEDQEVMGVEKQRPVKLNRRGPGARRYNEQDAGGIDPSVGAMFTMRARQTTAGPSPVTAVLRPLCGNRACGVVAESDPGTASGRILSLLGAAFPDGAAAPAVAFREPR